VSGRGFISNTFHIKRSPMSYKSHLLPTDEVEHVISASFRRFHIRLNSETGYPGISFMWFLPAPPSTYLQFSQDHVHSKLYSLW